MKLAQQVVFNKIYIIRNVDVNSSTTNKLLLPKDIGDAIKRCNLLLLVLQLL